MKATRLKRKRPRKSTWNVALRRVGALFTWKRDIFRVDAFFYHVLVLSRRSVQYSRSAHVWGRIFSIFFSLGRASTVRLGKKMWEKYCTTRVQRVLTETNEGFRCLAVDPRARLLKNCATNLCNAVEEAIQSESKILVSFLTAQLGELHFWHSLFHWILRAHIIWIWKVW